MRTPKELKARYKALFESDDGQVVLDDLQKRFHIFGTTFSTEPHEQAYCEGQRTVVLFLQSMLLDNVIKEQTDE